MLLEEKWRLESRVLELEEQVKEAREAVRQRGQQQEDAAAAAKAAAAATTADGCTKTVVDRVEEEEEEAEEEAEEEDALVESESATPPLTPRPSSTAAAPPVLDNGKTYRDGSHSLCCAFRFETKTTAARKGLPGNVTPTCVLPSTGSHPTHVEINHAHVQLKARPPARPVPSTHGKTKQQQQQQQQQQ